MEPSSCVDSSHFGSAAGELRMALANAEANILHVIEELDEQSLQRQSDYLECSAL